MGARPIGGLRGPFGEFNFAAREHAGLGLAPRRVGFQIDINDAVARRRIDRRRHRADLAGNPRATGQHQRGRRPGANAGEIGGGNLGAPFEPAAQDHAKQLLADRRHRADRRRAPGNDAVVGGENAGLAQAQFLDVEPRLSNVDTRLGSLFGGQVLGDLLLADRPAALELAGTVGVGVGFGIRGAGLGEGRARLREFGFDRRRRQGGEHLPLAHPVADIDPHLGQPQAADFAANCGFLPGGDVAAGRDALRPLRVLQTDGGHRERRLGRRRALAVGSLAAAARLAGLGTAGGEADQQGDCSELPGEIDPIRFHRCLALILFACRPICSIDHHRNAPGQRAEQLVADGARRARHLVGRQAAPP